MATGADSIAPRPRPKGPWGYPNAAGNGGHAQVSRVGRVSRVSRILEALLLLIGLLGFHGLIMAWSEPYLYLKSIHTFFAT
jgi:hypothetical protein